MTKKLSPTMQYASDIAHHCQQLEFVPGIDIFAVYLYLHNGEFTWLTNCPAAAQKYMDEGYHYADRLNRRDFTNSNRVIFTQEYDSQSLVQDEIYNKLMPEFGFHRIYCLSRIGTDCRLILAANSKIPVEDPQQYYNNTVSAFELFCCQFISRTIDIFLNYLPSLAPSRFAQSEAYRKMMITNRQDPPSAELSKAELELLYWSAQGKTAEEIAMILDFKKSTIETYRKRLLKKLNANNLTHAVYLAKTLGLLV